ncbi:hypothetical protein SAMN05877753_12012 [Bacillus oleivorans]|uniref:Uncharacterized protein n=1 Tax=Bacillus oleivorans TaxID=1448271 RepID=A0A285D7U5_9BACI|nr:hypothetical protein [Bacillus oleivorans]SNX75874.1 hypothetical protein SAMN05877753_12012 [Bacillus oleivorans]
MRVPYTYLEVEYMEHEYDQQVPVSVIAENVNKEFHSGRQVRNVNSIWYVISKLNNDDEWKNKLEDAWLETIS